MLEKKKSEDFNQIVSLGGSVKCANSSRDPAVYDVIKHKWAALCNNLCMIFVILRKCALRLLRSH